MRGNDGSRCGTVDAGGKAGDDDVVAIDGTKGIDVGIVGLRGKSGVKLIEGCFGSGHLQGQCTDPADGIVRVGEGHLIGIDEDR